MTLRAYSLNFKVSPKQIQQHKSNVNFLALESYRVYNNAIEIRQKFC